MTKQNKAMAAASIGFVIIFCTSFVFFYTRAQTRKVQPPPILAGEMGQPLPAANLLDISNVRLPDDSLRRGKVVLTFVHPDCAACKKESAFLKTVVGQNPNVTFYGVIPFGDRQADLEAAEHKYPFKVYFDEGFQLGGKLQITKVPIKMFLEDGVIKKVWDGATIEEQAQQDFVRWLGEVN
jgi:thiol-disulfide isomerase/thioredoxin